MADWQLFGEIFGVALTIGSAGWTAFLASERKALWREIVDMKATQEAQRTDFRNDIKILIERAGTTYATSWGREDQRVFEEKLSATLNRLEDKVDRIIERETRRPRPPLGA